MTTTGSEPIPRGDGRRGLVGSDNGVFLLPLRGRGWESEIVDQAVREVESGASRTLLMRGVAGVGKTRLLGEIADIARTRGWGVVVAVPEPESHLIPTAVLVDAALGASPPLLTPAEIEPLSGDADSRYWLTQALRNALEAVATTQGVAVLVDDLQWADSASLAVIRSLMTGLSDVPILWVFAVRSGDHGAAVNETVSAVTAAGATTLSIAPLADAAVGDMAADLLGAAPDPQLTGMLRRAENLPLLVSELVHGLIDENLVRVVGETATARESRLPERFGSSIRERIARLPGEAPHAVQVASTLGRSFTIANLGELLDTGAADLMRGVGAAIRADIFTDGTPLSFRHDVIRETAESMLAPAMRSYLRRRAADIRLRSGEPLLAVAASVAEAAEPGDAAAVVLLHDAAVQLAASDAAGAAGLAGRAVDLSTSSENDGLLAELIPVLWVGGQPEAAKALAAALRGSLAPEDQARVQLSIARLQTESSFTDAIRTCEEALAAEGVPLGVRAQLMAVRALNLANIGDHARLAGALDEARGAAELSGETIALATVNATESVLRFYQNRFDDAAELIGAATRQIDGSPGLAVAQWLPEGLWPAFLANSSGDSLEALRIADARVEETRRTRSAIAMAFWSMVRTRALFDLGRLDDAKLQAETVMTMAEELVLGDFAQATAGVVLYRVALHQGDYAACAALIDSVRAMAGGRPLHLPGTWLLALTADADGRLDDAVALTTDAYEHLEVPAPSMTTPADFSDDARLAGIWRRGGAHERLARLASVTRARSLANPANAFIRGIDEQVHGVIGGTVEQLLTAVGLLRRGQRPLPLAAALEDLALAMQEAKDPGADAVWHEAADIYEAQGAVRDAGRVLKRLRDSGVRRRPKAVADHRGVLSSRERDVAERLARGSTTKQVASDLSLSQSTVLTHVRHIYEKWGISSRKALSERVAAGRSGPRR